MKQLLAPTTAFTAWTGVLVQLYLSLHRALTNGDGLLLGLAEYLGYFTILTNILVACVVTVPLVAPSSAAGRRFADPRVSGMAAAAILVVGIAYHILLRGTWEPRGAELFTDTLLHYVVPTLFALYWVFAAPKAGLRFAHLPLMAIYPFMYFIYVVVRGELLGRYPYFFVDVASIGLLASARNAFGILVFYLIVAAVLLVVTARQRSAASVRVDRAQPEARR